MAVTPSPQITRWQLTQFINYKQLGLFLLVWHRCQITLSDWFPTREKDAMSKNNGMDSQDLDMPTHKYNAKKIISFFIFFSLILSTLIFWDSFSSWALLIFAVASTKTPCVHNTSSHVITEIINHRNKETDYFFLVTETSNATLSTMVNPFSWHH